VRQVEARADLFPAVTRARREVLNYFARCISLRTPPRKKWLTHEDVFKLHSIIAEQVMDQGLAARVTGRSGCWVGPHGAASAGRTFRADVRVAGMVEQGVAKAIAGVELRDLVHYRFEAIHPFCGRKRADGPALALWELYRRGFDTHHIFSVDEFLLGRPPALLRRAAGRATAREGFDFVAGILREGFQQTMERVWQRVQQLSASSSGAKLLLAAETGAAAATASGQRQP